MPTPKSQMKEAQKALIAIMEEHLSLISESIIAQLIKNYKTSTDSTKYNSIKDIIPKGVKAYKDDLLSAMAVVSGDALKQARAEVPSAKSVDLDKIAKKLEKGNFEDLPKDIQRRLKSSVDLMVETQINDLKKSIFFQFNSDIGGEITIEELVYDIQEKALDYIEGPAIHIGAGVTSANVVNESRSAFFFTEEVLEEIEAFKFINADPVSLICRSLAGLVFSKDDPNFWKYTPPLHYNCKSYIIPILKLKPGTKVQPLIPRKIDGYSNEQVMKSLQFSEHIKNCTCFSDFVNF